MTFNHSAYLQSRAMLYTIPFWFSFAEDLRHLDLKNKARKDSISRFISSAFKTWLKRVAITPQNFNVQPNHSVQNWFCEKNCIIAIKPSWTDLKLYRSLLELIRDFGQSSWNEISFFSFVINWFKLGLRH